MAPVVPSYPKVQRWIREVPYRRPPGTMCAATSRMHAFFEVATSNGKPSELMPRRAMAICRAALFRPAEAKPDLHSPKQAQAPPPSRWGRAECATRGPIADPEIDNDLQHVQTAQTTASCLATPRVGRVGRFRLSEAPVPHRSERPPLP
jgi:hypothetical protein